LPKSEPQGGGGVFPRTEEKAVSSQNRVTGAKVVQGARKPGAPENLSKGG